MDGVLIQQINPNHCLEMAPVSHETASFHDKPTANWSKIERRKKESKIPQSKMPRSSLAKHPCNPQPVINRQKHGVSLLVSTAPFGGGRDGHVGMHVVNRMSVVGRKPFTTQSFGIHLSPIAN
jgi:hypothetical protein